MAKSFFDDDDFEEPKAKPAPVKGAGSLSQITEQSVRMKSGAPILVIDRLGKDWEDLIVYSWNMKTILHVHRKDICESDELDATIETIKQIRDEK